MPNKKIEIPNRSNSERASDYAEYFEAKLNKIGITQIYSHGTSVGTPVNNTLYIYPKFYRERSCDDCNVLINLTQYVDILVAESSGKVTIPRHLDICYDSFCQNDSLRALMCEKHKEQIYGKKYIVILDEGMNPLAHYIPSSNVLVIERDITHSYTETGRKFIDYVLHKVDLIKNGDKKGTFNDLIKENILHSERVFNRFEQFNKDIEKCKRAYSSDINAFVRSKTDFFERFKEQSGKLTETIKKEEEKRLKSKYEHIIRQTTVQKERELSELKAKYASNFAIHNLQKNLPALQKEGFNIHIYQHPGRGEMAIHLLKKVKITFTCSSSFGRIIQPIKPHASMSIYMGAELSRNCTKIKSYRAFKEIAPIQEINGIHFLDNGLLCLGDANHLTNEPIESLPKSINEIIKLFENASFHHGVPIHHDSRKLFPKRVVEIYLEYINKCRADREDEIITEDELFDPDADNNDEN